MLRLRLTFTQAFGVDRFQVLMLLLDRELWQKADRTGGQGSQLPAAVYFHSKVPDQQVQEAA